MNSLYDSVGTWNNAAYRCTCLCTPPTSPDYKKYHETIESPLVNSYYKPDLNNVYFFVFLPFSVATGELTGLRIVIWNNFAINNYDSVQVKLPTRSFKVNASWLKKGTIALHGYRFCLNVIFLVYLIKQSGSSFNEKKKNSHVSVCWINLMKPRMVAGGGCWGEGGKTRCLGWVKVTHQ